MGRGHRLRKSGFSAKLIPMRRYKDHSGREWDAVLGRGSWGVYSLLFVPSGHSEPVREVQLAASSYEAALAEFEMLDQRALDSLFATSNPRND